MVAKHGPINISGTPKSDRFEVGRENYTNQMGSTSCKEAGSLGSTTQWLDSGDSRAKSQAMNDALLLITPQFRLALHIVNASLMARSRTTTATATTATKTQITRKKSAHLN